MTPAQRVLRSRRAAYLQHAAGRTNTGPARAAFNDRFERQVDPDGELSPDERARRAAFAKKAHFTHLALRSAQARSHKSEARQKAA